MTEEEVLKAKKTFAQWGVPENRIFSEIMRARYLDYYLFSNPTNAEYGITTEDLYKNMKMTAEKMGDFDGSEDTYTDVYTLSMRVNPMDFAEGVPRATEEMKALILSVIEKVKSAGQTVLLAGADAYLYMLPQIFYYLNDKRIAVSVNSQEWKEKLSYLFPRGRFMHSEEITGDRELYDYIFDIEKEDLMHIEELQKRLAENAVLDALIPMPVIMSQSNKNVFSESRLASSKMMEEYYNAVLNKEEFAFIKMRNCETESISFGEAWIENGDVKKHEALKVGADIFIEAHDWNYDVYRYNGSIALQTILAAQVVNLEHTVGSKYAVIQPEYKMTGVCRLLKENALTEDTGIRTELAETLEVSKKMLLTRIQNGDLLVFPGKEKIHTAVVYHIDEKTYVPDEITVIRPKGIYTSEYLKVYLEGPLGQLFMDTMKAENQLVFQVSRLMRFPLPEATEKAVTWITEECKNAVQQLSLAANGWRHLKKEAVHVMTKR